MDNIEKNITIMNYRKLTQKEAEELDNVGCQRQMDSILSQYYCQVYKHRYHEDYEGQLCHDYYVSDCKQATLAAELGVRADQIDYYLERVV